MTLRDMILVNNLLWSDHVDLVETVHIHGSALRRDLAEGIRVCKIVEFVVERGVFDWVVERVNVLRELERVIEIMRKG